LLEVWWNDNSNHQIKMHDSPDGSTWTSRGVQLSEPAWDGNSAGFGEGHAFYPADGSRWLVCDLASADSSGRRHRGLFKSADRSTTYTSDGTCFGACPINSWESAQVFDGQILGPVDTGDGNGYVYRLLYAGGDNANPTDNTNSSIGLAWLDPG